MPIQTSCPSCGKQLRVPDNLIGKNVKCPGCQTMFVAEIEGGPSEAPPPLPRESRREEAYREESPERRPRREEEYEEDRPSRRTSRRDDDYDEDDRDRDDDDYDRPRRRRRRSRPHRGGTIIGLGIGSIVGAICCAFIGLILGVVTIVMAAIDLRAMGEGRMDDSGRGQTMGGLICGIIAIILAIANGILGAMIQMGKFK